MNTKEIKKKCELLIYFVEMSKTRDGQVKINPFISFHKNQLVERMKGSFILEAKYTFYLFLKKGTLLLNIYVHLNSEKLLSADYQLSSYFKFPPSQA